MAPSRTTRLTGAALVIATVSWLAWLFLPDPVRRPLHRATLRAERRLRRWDGHLRGLRYRLARRRPDPDVPAPVLVDRVRSSLGPLEKRLDLPRVHVVVDGHVVLLHGDVPSTRARRRIEHAVARISGVRGVDSYLRVATIEPGARPSYGRAHPPASPALRHLTDAAYGAGAPATTAPRILRAVLGFLAERVPEGELDQLRCHLPRDVRALCAPPRHRGGHTSRVRTVDQLVAALATATDPLPPDQAEHVIESVIGALRDLVPEEDLDIAAVLPEDLRDFWLSSTPQ